MEVYTSDIPVFWLMVAENIEIPYGSYIELIAARTNFLKLTFYVYWKELLFVFNN